MWSSLKSKMDAPRLNAGPGAMGGTELVAAASPRGGSGSTPSPLPLEETARPRSPCRKPSCLKPRSREMSPSSPPSPSAADRGDDGPSAGQDVGHLLHLLLSTKSSPCPGDPAAPQPWEIRRPSRASRRTDVDRDDEAGDGSLRGSLGSLSIGRVLSTGSFRDLRRRGVHALDPTQVEGGNWEWWEARDAGGGDDDDERGATGHPGSLFDDDDGGGGAAREREVAAEKPGRIRNVLISHSLSFMRLKMKEDASSTRGHEAESHGTDPGRDDESRPAKGRPGDVSALNDSISFMRGKMEKETETQRREEPHDRGRDSRSNDNRAGITGSRHGPIMTPGSDLFRRYLEHKAKTKRGVAGSPAPEGDRAPSPGFPAQSQQRGGRLLVEWGDAATATTESADGERRDAGKHEKHEVTDVNVATTNPQLLVEWGDAATTATEKSDGERRIAVTDETQEVVDTDVATTKPDGGGRGEGAAAPGGRRPELAHRCITIDHRTAGRRLSDLTCVEMEDVGLPSKEAARPPASPALLRRRIRSSSVVEESGEEGEEHNGRHHPAPLPVRKVQSLAYLPRAGSYGSDGISMLSKSAGPTDGVCGC